VPDGRSREPRRVDTALDRIECRGILETEYHPGGTRMAARKFAISIPAEVMSAVDEAAGKRGWTRSRFISYVLRVAARAQSDAAIRRQIDAVFADPELAAEQRETAAAFGRAASAAGTRW